MDVSHTTWNDVDIVTDGASHEHPEQSRERLYVISAGMDIDSECNNMSAELNNNNMVDHTRTQGNNFTDDHYQVADDTSVLVNKDNVPSHRHRHGQSRDTDRSSRDRDHGVVADDNGSHHTKMHYCHNNQKVTIDKTARNQLIVVSVLCAIFMVAEILGGVLSNSLALVTDATHMASDLASFLVSLLAIWLAKKPPNHKMTLGYHRAEVLGALTSILIIWVVTGILVYVAARRIQEDDYHIHADEMLIVASIGVVFNIIMGLILHSGIVKKCRLPSSIGHNHSHGNNNHHDDHHLHHSYHESECNHYEQHGYTEPPHGNNQLNSINADIDHNVVTELDPQLLHSHLGGGDSYGAIRDTARNTAMEPKVIVKPKRNINIQAAAIHVVGDFIQSIGVLIAAVIIKIKPEYQIADPICTFLFSVLVLITTITIARDVVLVLIEAKPRGIDYHAIHKDLRQLDGVRSVHSLSLWSLTVNKTAATVHIAIDNSVSSEYTLEGATKILRQNHGVYTSTVQIEHYTALMEDCTFCHD